VGAPGVLSADCASPARHKQKQKRVLDIGSFPFSVNRMFVRNVRLDENGHDPSPRQGRGYLHFNHGIPGARDGRRKLALARTLAACF
jgi:hypothetical protein